MDKEHGTLGHRGQTYFVGNHVRVDEEVTVFIPTSFSSPLDKATDTSVAGLGTAAAERVWKLPTLPGSEERTAPTPSKPDEEDGPGLAKVGGARGEGSV